MEQIYCQLEILIANARKSLHRAYTVETVQAKREEILKLERKVEKLLNDTEISEQVRQRHTEKFVKLRNDALDVLKLHFLYVQRTEGKPIGKIEKGKEDINKMASIILNANELSSYSILYLVE